MVKISKAAQSQCSRMYKNHLRAFFFFFKYRFQDLRDSRMLLIITPEEKASLCVNIPLPLSVWACPIPHCKHCEGGDCFHLLFVSSAQHNMLLKEEWLKHPLYVTKMKPGALSSKILSTAMYCIRLNLGDGQSRLSPSGIGSQTW